MNFIEPTFHPKLPGEVSIDQKFHHLLVEPTYHPKSPCKQSIDQEYVYLEPKFFYKLAYKVIIDREL